MIPGPKEVWKVQVKPEYKHDFKQQSPEVVAMGFTSQQLETLRNQILKFKDIKVRPWRQRRGLCSCYLSRESLAVFPPLPHLDNF